ncbi:MAG: cellulase family glycosylhydrolase [Anaerolineales bacterium]|nr:cellulase family glycosylhydrolase [Anaerolineales bacterium]
MDAKWKVKLWRFVMIMAIIGLIFSLWPAATSLYDLTGEEALPGQLAGLVHWLNTAVRPQPQLALETAAAHTDVNIMGVNTFLQQEVEPEKRELSLQMSSTAGFRFIRQEFQWEDIEIHGKGDFVDRRNDAAGVDAWAKYDNIVDLAEQQNIEIIARLSNPPSWSRELSDEEIGTLAPPDDFNDFGDFVATVAERYDGRIHYFQIWNEPNGNEEWGKQDVNPEAYTELLCAAYARIKAVNPETIVLAGALTPTVAMDGRHMNDLIYLQRMYNAGAADCFDIMSAQGYGLWSGAADQRLKPTVINYPHNLYLRDLMVRNGDAAKPIWISELGWNVVPEGIEARFGRVTEEQQARYAVEAYRRAQAEWPWIGVINYWFLKRPADWEKDQSWYYFRLLEPDFIPLPVYDALVDYGQNSPAVSLRSNWVYVWNELRPLFFTFSSTILFFALLNFLSSGIVENKNEG